MTESPQRSELMNNINPGEELRETRDALLQFWAFHQDHAKSALVEGGPQLLKAVR